MLQKIHRNYREVKEKLILTLLEETRTKMQMETTVYRTLNTKTVKIGILPEQEVETALKGIKKAIFYARRAKYGTEERKFTNK